MNIDKVEIRNEIKPKNNEPQEKKEFVHRSLVDIQRIKLEKLMKNPDKPVIIPESQKTRDFNNSVPSFVRNVMGSSAGAGSGEFHVYRNLRRKEYARLKAIDDKSKREEKDEEFRARLEQHQKDADDKTAKKREKRHKRKQKGNAAKKGKGTEKQEWKPLSDDELLNEESDTENKSEAEENISANEELTKKDVKEESDSKEEEVADDVPIGPVLKPENGKDIDKSKTDEIKQKNDSLNKEDQEKTVSEIVTSET